MTNGEDQFRILWDWMNTHKQQYIFLVGDVKENTVRVKRNKERLSSLDGLEREVKTLRTVMVISIFAIAINVIVFTL